MCFLLIHPFFSIVLVYLREDVGHRQVRVQPDNHFGREERFVEYVGKVLSMRGAASAAFRFELLKGVFIAWLRR